MIGFLLGREYKLSIAEIMSVFPEGKTVYFGSDFLILENLDEEKVLKKANNLWWTIKIIKIVEDDILNIAEKSEWKFQYWISAYWIKKNLKNILIQTKKELKNNNISSRFINKDFQNISSAQIIWEKLIQKKSDFTYIYSKDNTYFGYTIWVQDINNYSKRDYSKDRDMQTWMLPPKLCQMMINMSGWKTIYDPFVWLWTVLIESILMWNNKVYWSDLNEIMVEKSSKNIREFATKNSLELKDFEIIKLNSKFINESTILQEKNIDSIVTEWYLWEIMTQKNISLDRINKQKESLLSLYSKFFENLSKINYSWNIVICFPFWEMNNKNIYFEEVYEIVEQFSDIQNIFKNEEVKDLTTKKWSLLYKREKQLVWREIFVLKIKEAN